jgi:lysyl-tRNA synthetase class 2
MSGPDENPDREAPTESASDLLRNRRENLRRVEELGFGRTPLRFPITATVSEIAAQHRERPAEELESARIPVTTAGRVLALRTAGKAGFLDLSDGRERVQVYLKRDGVGEQAFELYRALDLGDWLGVEGEVFKTRTGELSVKAKT